MTEAEITDESVAVDENADRRIDQIHELRCAAADVLYRIGEWERGVQAFAFDELPCVATDLGSALRRLRIAADVRRDENGYPSVALPLI